MAFHVACPITCRKICYCISGTPAPLITPQGRKVFMQDVLDLERLLSKPGFLAAGGEEMVDILVPRLGKDLKAKRGKFGPGHVGGDSGEDTPISMKVVMRKKATMAAIAAAEAASLAEQARRVAEAARLCQITAGGITNGVAGQVTCEICFHGEVIGSREAERLVPCPSCKKTFHRSCIKHWADNRDLFNWSSWVCGTCRLCEVCRRTGDPNKLMFCKRCDSAYHAYCQQPPLKHVPKGPFLCPKHTLCHGCGSRVPGSGFSSRWFLDFTMCDACGRLFIKGKYCSVCLKVYRDSESTPMVCCDNCEHWVHAHCDGISDEKYYEFQLDNNLHYTCAACRGETYKVKNVADAVEELWRRRDLADKDVIRQCQAAAGVPSKEENAKLCPSDDEDDKTLLEVKKVVKEVSAKGKDHGDVDRGRGIIKKSKITLPTSSNMSSIKSKDLPPHARESIVASNGKLSFSNHNAGTKVRLKSSLAPNDRQFTFGKPHSKAKQSEAFPNPNSSVKFVDNARDKAGTTGYSLFSAGKKGTLKGPVQDRIEVDGDESQRQTNDEYISDKGSESSSSSSDSMQEGREDSLATPYVDEGVMASQRTVEAWVQGVQGGSFRTRAPNLKYRDKGLMLPKPSNSFEDTSIGEDLASNDATSGKDGVMAKRLQRDVESAIISEDEDFSGSPSKRANLYHISNTASTKLGNGSTVRGQRSKRKKHHDLESHRHSLKDLVATPLSLDRERKPFFDDTGVLQKLGRDDTEVLQKLGKDAVGKKVEVFSPRGRIWCRGRVVEAPSLKSHVTVRFEDGIMEKVEFGKRRVRILSQLGKRGRT